MQRATSHKGFGLVKARAASPCIGRPDRRRGVGNGSIPVEGYQAVHQAAAGLENLPHAARAELLRQLILAKLPGRRGAVVGGLSRCRRGCRGIAGGRGRGARENARQSVFRRPLAVLVLNAV